MTRALPAILFTWAGVLLGVSFIATPAKFLAPSLAMAQALDVGRWTFHVLALVEWGFVAIVAMLLVLTWRAGAGRGSVAAIIAVVAAVLAVETFMLRPLLDERVLKIIAGEGVLPSSGHNIYIVLEALRLVLIFAAGVLAIGEFKTGETASIVGPTEREFAA